MKASRRAPSLLFVLAAHALLLWALMQLAPTAGSSLAGLPPVAWLSLSLPLPRHTPGPAPAAEPKPAPTPVHTAQAADERSPSSAVLPPTGAAAEAEVQPPAPAPMPAPAPAPAHPAAAQGAAVIVATTLPATPPPEPALTRPDHTHCQPPPYPPPLRERGIEGAVQLRVQVDTQGRAAAVLLQTTSGWRLFDEAALAQARACRFQPARRNGVAVDSWVEFPMRFALTAS